MADTDETNNMQLRDIQLPRNDTNGIAPSDLQPDDRPETNATSLPPVDGGRAAWRLLLAAFVFEALLWGSSRNPSMSNSQIRPLTMRKAFHFRSVCFKTTIQVFLNFEILHLSLLWERLLLACRTSPLRSSFHSSKDIKDTVN